MEKGDKIILILENSACLKSDQLIGYLSGSLFPEELRVVELHLASCSLCQDALEGMALAKNSSKLIDELTLPNLTAQKGVLKNSAETAANQKLTPFNTPKRIEQISSIPKSTFSKNPYQQNLRPKNYSWLGVTGIAALLLLGGYLFWQYENTTTNWPSFSFNFQKRSIELPTDSTTAEKEDSIPSRKPLKGLVVENNTALLPGKSLPPKDTAQGIAPANSIPVLSKATKEPTDASLLSVAKPQTTAISRKGAPSEDVKELDTNGNKQALAAAITKTSKSIEKKSGTNKEVIDQNPNTTISASHNNFSPSDFNTGVSLYQKKQYASALLYLRTAATDNQNPNYWQALYYSGLCNIEIGKKGKAKRLLKKVENANVPLSVKAREQLINLDTSVDK